MQTIQPMSTTKIHEGKYHILDTSTECIVEKCVNGRWALDSNGEFVASFDTKRDALIYCQEHSEL